MPFQLSEELVDKLLDKLSTDNEFREVFQRSPRIALAYLGHEAASTAADGDKGVWSCLVCEKLASPEEVKASRDELKKQLVTTRAAYSPVTLDTARKSS